jgi:hypothetical protein
LPPEAFFLNFKAKNMKKYLLILSLIIGSLAMLSSCQYYWIEVDEPFIPDTVSFSRDVIPIFEEGCNVSVCHGGSKAPDLRPDNAYQSLMTGGYVNTAEPALSTIYTCLISGGSMEQYAKQGDDALILSWIEQGAKDN